MTIDLVNPEYIQWDPRQTLTQRFGLILNAHADILIALKTQLCAQALFEAVKLANQGPITKFEKTPRPRYGKTMPFWAGTGLHLPKETRVYGKITIEDPSSIEVLEGGEVTIGPAMLRIRNMKAGQRLERVLRDMAEAQMKW